MHGLHLIWRARFAVLLTLLAINLPAHARAAQLENIAPQQLPGAVLRSEGRTIVLLTSKDPNCTYCVPANPAFASFAAKHAKQARFVMSSWEPWLRAFDQPAHAAFERELLKFSGSIKGLPMYLLFVDGQYLASASGNIAISEMEKVLLNDARPPKPVASEAIENIAPNALAGAVAKNKGRMVVLLSSIDPGCVFCLRMNPLFAELANKRAKDARFVISSWEPWLTTFEQPGRARFERDVLKADGSLNGLPALLVYDDGVLIGRVNGVAPLAELEQKTLSPAAH